MTPLRLLVLLLRLVLGLAALSAALQVVPEGFGRLLVGDALRGVSDLATAAVLLFVAGVALFGTRFLRLFAFSNRPA